MIAEIVLMIGLYIIARYCEMFLNASKGTKIMLAIFSIITILCIIDLILSTTGFANAFQNLKS